MSVMKAEVVLPLVLALDKKERCKILKILQEPESKKQVLTDADAKRFLIKFFKR